MESRQGAVDEAYLQRAQEISQEVDVKGMVLVDGNGLCVYASGVGKEASSGDILQICRLAEQLGEGPTIQIEFEDATVTIASKDKTTMAIYK